MMPGMRYESMVSGWEENEELTVDSDKAKSKVEVDSEVDSPTTLTRVERIEQCFKAALDEQFDKELERGQSLVGPHRDEIVFYLDKVELRRYGSQGQHRLFALALKLGQLDYYTKELEDAPLLVLDDVFGDLDGERVRILLEHLKAHQGQSFITAAHPVAFSDFVDFDHPDHLCITIKDGNVAETN
jgi:DNA replication and repair protein RecF